MRHLRALLLCALFFGCAQAQWPCMQCGPPITDETAVAQARWDAAACEDAWNAVLFAWENYSADPNTRPLSFTNFVSNFFGGPADLQCTSVIATDCSVGISCQETQYPAGYLILNSLFTIHQIAQNTYWTIQIAGNSIDTQLVADTFAPLLLTAQNPSVAEDLLSGLALFVGFLSAFTWNIALSQTTLFATRDMRTFAKDSFNNEVVFSVALVRQHLAVYGTAIPAEASVEAALQYWIALWGNLESNYTQNIFNGSATSNDLLWELIQNGTMLAMPNNVTLESGISQIETVAYAQLIQFAWQNGPGNFVPFVLKSGESCETSGVPMGVSTWMSEDTANQARVCWNDVLFYVLAVNPQAQGIESDIPGPGFLDNLPFVNLPGGTNDVLDGSKYGGVTLMDIVQSVYGAWLVNNNENGYEMPTPSTVIDDTGNLVEYSISDPGFFNTIPLCNNIFTTVMMIGGFIGKSANYPCD